ncbi:hypothetical protein SLEP1_g47543 [Rubroshorea leprosula]|uniref:Maturase K n=1 Tax=Rubroshorea leprosula TaxID=152421 RepID=A0AAV5LSQ8_9ROSI|nr:hypothetical protein SLEP1_g47543 [Rubroshorea leprosula]
MPKSTLFDELVYFRSDHRSLELYSRHFFFANASIFLEQLMSHILDP